MLKGRDEGSDVEAAGTDAPLNIAETRTRRLLIVEDDGDLARASQLILAHPFIEVETATNGIEAIRKARRFRPHAILLDVLIPLIDGFR